MEKQEVQREAVGCHILAGESMGEIVEKKSRFIASLKPVSSEEEALAFIDRVRKKYYDARHNCFAYLLREGGIARSSDDGEPSGTAGRPMLEALRGAGLTNVAAVVTRYFGGTLLGTGGLVRAYTQAVQQALAGSEIVAMGLGMRYKVTVDYGMTGKLQHLFAGRQIIMEDTVYTDKVEFHILVPGEAEEGIRREIMELTGAKAAVEKLCATWYPLR